MKPRIVLFFLMSYLVSFSLAHGQGMQISGKISTASGDPAAGTTVTIKGTHVATSADSSGFYKITVPSSNTVLVFTLIGMQPVEMVVGNNPLLNVTLQVGNNTLNEIVVVGYGTQTRRTVTGAVSSVKASDLENMPVMRIEQSLQGRTSGLTITANSGQPGEASTVRVRGTTTIGNSSPLYIVDGVQVGGGIDYLSQSDIESIEVLKDAASAAIYGARAANGVILITTKKGRRNQMSVSYNGYMGTQQPWRKLHLLDATQYATLLNEATVASGGNIRFADPAALGKGTDWQSQVFNNAAPIQNHELGISGGSDRSTYYASFGYLDQQGIVASSNSQYKRFTVRFNSSHKITNAITFGNNIGYTRTKSVGVGTNDEWGSPLNRAINIDPTTPLIETDPIKINQAPYTNANVVRDANGYPYGISTIVTSEILNPIAALKVAQGNGWSDKIVGNAYLEIEPVKKLKIRSSIGTDLAFWGSESFSPLFYLNAVNQNTLNGYTRSQSRGMFWLWENTASYNRNIGKHDFAVVVGTSAQRNYGEQQGGTKRGIPADKLKDASLSFPVPQTNQFFWGSEYQETLASLFGRLNYNYDGKYLLTGVVRRDGSSRFGSNNKYGVFPSLSLGWVASRENFWSTNNPITFLKIRGSYGVNGNNQIGDFLYLSTVGGGRNYTMGGTLVNGVSPNAISNPDLKWEETSQANIGFDAVILKNINLTVDLYNKKTTGMLLGISVPGYVGNNGPTGNIADMENRGVEVELGYNNKIGKLNYNIKGNVTYLENEVTYLGADKKFLNGQTFGPQGVQITRTQVGYPIGSFYGFKTNGLFQNNTELNAYVNKEGTLLQPNARPGDIRFVDINGDGQINNDDRTIIGNPTPDYTFGFTAAFSYSQFDMVVFGQGVAGNQVFQAIRRFDLPTSNWTTEAISRWTGEGTSTYFPRLVLNDPNQNFSRSSEFYLQDGSYFRFKTVQLGYTIPNHLTQKIGLNKVRLYVTGNNLLTFTNYNGFDPEIGGGSYGVDRGIYPQARAYLFGLNLGF